MRPSAVLLFLLCLATAVLTSAQSTQADLTAHLVDQPLFLRDRPVQDQLRFAADGTLIPPAAPATFTLSGVAVHSVELRKDRLILKGRRVGVKFVQDQPVPVPLSLLDGAILADEAIRIEIVRPPSGDYTAALDRIFARNLADLVPSLPPFWQAFAQAHLLPSPAPVSSIAAPAPPSTTSAPPPDPTATTLPVATAVPPNSSSRPIPSGDPQISKANDQPPRLLKSVEPDYPLRARAARYSGAVSVNLVIDSAGRPTRLSIVHPAGLGLDEQALAAVAQYRFQPAMHNGQPVPVQINIDVNFHIF